MIAALAGLMWIFIGAMALTRPSGGVFDEMGGMIPWAAQVFGAFALLTASIVCTTPWRPGRGLQLAFAATPIWLAMGLSAITTGQDAWREATTCLGSVERLRGSPDLLKCAKRLSARGSFKEAQGYLEVAMDDRKRYKTLEAMESDIFFELAKAHANQRQFTQADEMFALIANKAEDDTSALKIIDASDRLAYLAGLVGKQGDANRARTLSSRAQEIERRIASRRKKNVKNINQDIADIELLQRRADIIRACGQEAEAARLEQHRSVILARLEEMTPPEPSYVKRQAVKPSAKICSHYAEMRQH